MRARLVGDATYSLVIEEPAPAVLERYGKTWRHCGTVLPEYIAVYRAIPFGGGRAMELVRTKWITHGEIVTIIR